MLLQQQQQQLLARGQQHCPSIANQRKLVASSGCRAARRAAQRKLFTPAATAAPAAEAAPGAAKGGRPRKYAPRKPKDAEEQQAQQDEPDLPVPLDYQQTLIKSFTVGGVGLHTAEYAVVRVRPAFAGEGRYFVRVPEGTNRGKFAFEADNFSDRLTVDEAMDAQTPEEDEDVEDLKLDWFELYLRAQEERGYDGSFNMFMQLQVELGELDEATYRRIMGIQRQDLREPELPEGMGVEPDTSMVVEDIEPLNDEDPGVVPASITAVSDVDRNLPFTTLGEGDNKVMNVELLLAALETCGVDNCRIEIEGGHEVPVLDNSALGWCIEVQCAGLRPAPIRFGDEMPEGDTAVVRRDVIVPARAIAVQDDEGWIAFFPGPFANITFGVDHSHVAPVIGSMWHTWRSDDTHFRYSLAPARAYVESIQQLYAMRDAGLVKAGAENLFNIACGDRWWDPELQRMVYDEPVRYRLAQLIGNLSLLNVAGCQGIPIGHVTAHNATPSLQVAFARAVLESLEQEDVMPVNNVVLAQNEWMEQRYSSFVHRESTSQGPEPFIGDGGSPAVIEADVQVIGPNEEL